MLERGVITSELNKLPNIGKTMQKRLAEIGIVDSSELYELGSRVAFAKLHLHEGDTCFSSLCALEGAIQGIRWHDLNEDMKKELKEFFDSFE
jgi:DNA transformation protein and related proteins